ncbi:hypothetical protein ALI44B_04905 [Leifsonia sp. ALI-44-B]|jgi:hypothetical protein|uniref:hypothetical protein n=1 Tax=Leifsonia sp. ALI-44-B TaxID=1933776 RepID=UPI00097C1F09|nr:hypothetical protein [Leifsonia sp. ALI-44-B]ONI63954.1 hypothetical protein ALI44B_04905 [Leifsonia sp. ALI-44-B]
MILRIDPSHVMVWTSPTTVQFGIDRSVLTLTVDPVRERLLSALQAGCTFRALCRVGRIEPVPARVGLSEADVEGFVRALRPVLLRPPGSGSSSPVAAAAVVPGAPAPVHVLQCTTSGSPIDEAAPARAIAELLRVAGRPVMAGRGVPPAALHKPAFAVLLASWSVPPAAFQRYTSDGVPHLPVVFGDESVRVGPLVRPGVGACVRCLHLAHRDREPAWPVIAAQLAGTRAPQEGGALAFDAAGRAARVARTWLDERRDVLRGGSVSLQVRARSEKWTWHRPHAECGCRSP